MIPGVVVSMGGKDWKIPPLTLGQLRRLMPKVRELTTVGASMGEDQIGILCEIVWEALGRNYPNTMLSDVEELLDLGNARDVLQAVLGASGLRQTGEAKAVAMNGIESMDSSPPLADTAILQ